MCKVSTLRPVESISLKFLHHSKLLPKIEEVNRNEYDGKLEPRKPVNVTLPSLIDKEEPMSPGNARMKISPRKTEIKDEIAAGDIEVLSARRLLSARQAPVSNTRQNYTILTPRKPKENISDDNKLLKRRRAQKSLSVPLMSVQNQQNETCQGNCAKFDRYQELPSPSLANKRRPGTPFVLSRARSVDMKQAWGEIENAPRLSKTSSKSVCDSLSYCRTVKRDKPSAELPEVSGISGKEEERHGMLPDKIRMDEAAFKKWIIEQREG